MPWFADSHLQEEGLDRVGNELISDRGRGIFEGARGFGVCEGGFAFCA